MANVVSELWASRRDGEKPLEFIATPYELRTSADLQLSLREIVDRWPYTFDKCVIFAPTIVASLYTGLCSVYLSNLIRHSFDLGMHAVLAIAAGSLVVPSATFCMLSQEQVYVRILQQGPNYNTPFRKLDFLLATYSFMCGVVLPAVTYPIYCVYAIKDKQLSSWRKQPKQFAKFLFDKVSVIRKPLPWVLAAHLIAAPVVNYCTYYGYQRISNVIEVLPEVLQDLKPK